MTEEAWVIQRDDGRFVAKPKKIGVGIYKKMWTDNVSEAIIFHNLILANLYCDDELGVYKDCKPLKLKRCGGRMQMILKGNQKFNLWWFQQAVHERGGQIFVRKVPKIMAKKSKNNQK